MKIPAAAIQNLADLTATTMSAEAWEKARGLGHSPMKFRWNAMFAVPGGNQFILGLYDLDNGNVNDAHIDTALRSICRDRGLPV